MTSFCDIEKKIFKISDRQNIMSYIQKQNTQITNVSNKTNGAINIRQELIQQNINNKEYTTNARPNILKEIQSQ